MENRFYNVFGFSLEPEYLIEIPLLKDMFQHIIYRQSVHIPFHRIHILWKTCIPYTHHKAQKHITYLSKLFHIQDEKAVSRGHLVTLKMLLFSMYYILTAGQYLLYSTSFRYTLRCLIDEIIQRLETERRFQRRCCVCFSELLNRRSITVTEIISYLYQWKNILPEWEWEHNVDPELGPYPGQTICHQSTSTCSNHVSFFPSSSYTSSSSCECAL
mgnify:FL=1